MSAQDLLEVLRIRPFKPFRIYASDGRCDSSGGLRTYDVRHPDQALVLRTRVIMPLPTNGTVPEGSEHLALAHIVRAEEIPLEAAPAAR